MIICNVALIYHHMFTQVVHIKYHGNKRLDSKIIYLVLQLWRMVGYLLVFFVKNWGWMKITCEMSPRISKGLSICHPIVQSKAYHPLCSISFSSGVNWNQDKGGDFLGRVVYHMWLRDINVGSNLMAILI